MKEIRCRTRVVGAFPDGSSDLTLSAARLRHIARTSWGRKRHLNIYGPSQGHQEIEEQMRAVTAWAMTGALLKKATNSLYYIYFIIQMKYFVFYYIIHTKYILKWCFFNLIFYWEKTHFLYYKFPQYQCLFLFSISFLSLIILAGLTRYFSYACKPT